MNINEVISAVEMVYGRLGEEASIDESRLENCERILNTKLPDALRTLYIRTGAHRFHQACDELVTPEQLTFDGDFLVFYKQDQGSIFWGINCKDLLMDDPQVWAIYDDEVLSDSSSVSDFLAFEAAWQAINGGALPCYGILDGYTQEEDVTFSPDTFKTAGEFLAQTRHGTIRYKTGAISLHRVEGDGFLGLAATTDSVFHEIAKDLGVAFDDWTITSFIP